MIRALILLLLVPLAACGGAPAGYLDTIPVFWRGVYPDGGRGLYCEQRFAAGDRGYNIEHVYPMSWVTRALGCGNRDSCRRKSPRFNEIESDMHNLYPARRDVNKARGSYPFREIPGERGIETGCDFEVDHKARVAEPPPASRGNVARAMLYMSERYGLEIFERQRRMLLEWHADDPVDEEERRRNRAIAKIQGNANPWIE